MVRFLIATSPRLTPTSSVAVPDKMNGPGPGKAWSSTGTVTRPSGRCVSAALASEVIRSVAMSNADADRSIVERRIERERSIRYLPNLAARPVRHTGGSTVGLSVGKAGVALGGVLLVRTRSETSMGSVGIKGGWCGSR